MPFDLQHPVRAIEADGYTAGEVSLRRYAGRCAAGEVQDGLQIPRTSPFHITLSVAEAAELNRRAAKYRLPYFEVAREQWCRDTPIWGRNTSRHGATDWQFAAQIRHKSGIGA